MKIERQVTKLAQQWQSTTLNNKLLLIVYFFIGGLASSGLLTILISISEVSKEKQFQLPVMVQIKQKIFSEDVSTITLSLIGIYWISVILSGIMGFIGCCENGKFIFSMLVVIIDLFSNTFTFYLLKAISCKISNIIVVLSVVTIIATFLFTSFHHLIFIDLATNPKNHLSHRYNVFIFVNKLIQHSLFALHLIIVLFAQQSERWIHVYYIGLVFNYGARLYSLAKKRYFLKSIAHYLHVFVTVLNLVILIISQLQFIFESQLIEKSFFQIIGIIALFGMTAFYQFNEFKFQHVLLMQINEIINSGQETFYLDALCQLYHNKTQNDWQFLVSGFCKIHSLKKYKTKTLIWTNTNTIQQNQQENNLNQRKKFQEFQNHVKNVINYILSHTNNNQAIQQCLYLKLVLFEKFFFVHTYIQQTTNFKQKSLFSKLSKRIILKEIESIIKTQNRRHLLKINTIPIMNLQNILQSMRQIIIKDLTIKSLKWKLLCNDFCKSRQIEENIQFEVQNLVKFHSIYQQNFQNYKKNFQFQQLSLFYFSSVIFNSKKCCEINKNIKNILTSQRINKIAKKEQKLLPSIQSSRYCYLQLNISEIVEQKIIFLIKNHNKNATKIFNCKDSKKLFGTNLLQLFPEFIIQSVKKMVQNEVKTKKGKILNMYLLDWQRNVFEAFVSFKVIFIENKVSCVMLIEKKKTDNLMLLDSQGFIHNIGKKYMDLFTAYNYQGLHFSTLLSNPQEFDSLEFNRCEQQKWYGKNMKFLDIEQKKQQWIALTERIKRLAENRLKIKTKNIQLAYHQQMTRQKNIKPFDLHDYYKLVKKQRQSLGKKQNHVSDDDGISNSIKIDIKFKKCRVNQKVFFIIQLDKISKSKQKQNKCFNRTNQGQEDEINQVVGEDYNENKQSLKKGTIKNLLKSKKYVSAEQKQQSSSEQSSRISQNEKDFAFAQTSTNTSVVSTSTLNRPLMNFSQQILECPKSFSDKRLIKFSLLSFLLFIQVGLIILIGYVVLDKYLTQQRQMMEIECQVNDSFQLAQLLYNSAMTYHTFRKNIEPIQIINGKEVNLTSQYLDFIKRSYFQQRQLLMTLFLNHQANFDSKHTKMTKQHFFKYLNEDSKWRGLAQRNSASGNKNYVQVDQKVKANVQDTVWVQIDQQQIQIVTGQMLMLYTTHSDAVIFNTTNDNINHINDSINLQVEKSLSLMKVNFPQLKRLNHYHIYYYGELVKQTFQTINLIIYVFFSVHAVSTIVLLLLVFIDKNFRQQQASKMIQLYTFLPSQATPKLYTYFTTLKQTFQEFSSFNHTKNSNARNRHPTFNHQVIQNMIKPNEMVQSQYLSPNVNTKHDIAQNNKTQSKLNIKKKSPCSNTNLVSTKKNNTLVPKMMVFAIAANFLFVFGMYKLIILNSTIDQVVLGIGSLMDAQNYLLESYFDLKANFIVPNPRYDDQFFTELLENQQSVDVIFNKIALKSLQIFTKYDPDYSDDFVDLLRDDLCKIIRQQLNDFQYAQCIDNSQMQYFQNGIAITMNFITRKIYQTILQVRQKVNNYIKNQTDKFEIYEILRLSQHREINQNLFYIFKMFQTLQKRVNLELQAISVITINQCLIYIILELIIVMLIFPFWAAFNYNKQKQKIRKLYLSLLLLNQEIIGQSIRVIQKATHILEFQHDGII